MKETPKKLKWGLIGNSKIANYSLAPIMWKSLFKSKQMNVSYFILGKNLSSEISQNLKKYSEDPLFLGANIALPWKYLGYEHCNRVLREAKKVKTINTILKKGKIIEGYNTDGKGITNAIKELTNIKNKKILILGSGSSSQTMPHHLLKEKARKIYVTDIIDKRAKDLSQKYSFFLKRRKIMPLNYEKIKEFLGEIEILINATPCGMKGYKEKYPLRKRDLNHIKKECLIVEAVYNPHKTPLLEYFEKKGNMICPGVKMLVEQAAISFKIVFGEILSKKEKSLMEKSALKGLQKK